MLEEASRGELTVDRKAAEELIVAELPYYGLIERIRIHDFHRYGITPPNPAVNEVRGYGPTTLKASRGEAVLSLTPQGPKTTCTGNSSVKERRPIHMVNDTFFDDDTEKQVALATIIRDFLIAVPKAVCVFEGLYKRETACESSDASQPVSSN